MWVQLKPPLNPPPDLELRGTDKKLPITSPSLLFACRDFFS